MSTEESAEAFVAAFCRLMPEGTLHDFQQVLDLKGIYYILNFFHALLVTLRKH